MRWLNRGRRVKVTVEFCGDPDQGVLHFGFTIFGELLVFSKDDAYDHKTAFINLVIMVEIGMR